MKLSIIILNWNTKELLKQALESIYAQTSGFDFEVIIADNGSSDGSQQLVKADFPQAILLENGSNLGFAKGNNAALKIAQGEYLMLLNSDIIVMAGAINRLVEYLDEHQEIYLAGPRLINADGTFQASCRRRLPDPWNSFVYIFGLSKLFGGKKSYHSYENEPEEQDGLAEAISGAAMIFRRKTYEEIGGLDEAFFMYGEDLDFCQRSNDKFGPAGYVGTATIKHLYGQSSKKRKSGAIVDFYEAMWIYYKKHYYKKYHPLFSMLVFVGIKLKLAIALIINLFK